MPHALNEAPLLLSIHGIRTTGRWQKELTEAAEAAGVRYRPLDFGYFMALSLLLPWARKKKVEWFHQECERHLANLPPGRRASIVAHSFGTYLLTSALMKYSDFHFDRVILCGSIVRNDFPWTSIIRDRKQVDAVLNEVGGKDIWASVVAWVVEDAGQSGAKGFDDLAGGRVTERRHLQHGHSDFFYSGNYRNVWMPFIRGEAASPVVTPGDMRRNWRFSVVAFVLVVVLGYFAWSALVGGESNSTESPEQVVPDGSRTLDSNGDPEFTTLPFQPNRSAEPETREVIDKAASVGTAATARGCSVQDEDEDGIDNCTDLCVESKPGSSVADNGCPILPIVHFDFDHNSLRPDAVASLDSAVSVLTLHPHLNVEITGHTRGRGTPQSDRALSYRRASAVRDYLLSRGVSTDQLLEPLALGNERPAFPEVTADGELDRWAASQNDRVELRLVERMPDNTEPGR